MDKIHFIHIPKNGGMSIRKAPELKQRITTSTKNNHISPEYTNNLLKTMNKYNEHHGYEHARWRDLKESLKNGKSFAIVRNPWSKVVSRYTFMQLAFKLGSKYVEKSLSFEEFLEERHTWGGKEYFWHRAIKGWYPQLEHVVDDDMNLRCDILRFEYFNEDVMKYFNLKTPLNPRNVSNIIKRDYKGFFTPITQEIVADWYKKDIEFFGFTFEGTATQHIWNKK